MHGAKKHKRSVYLSVFLRLLDIFLSILKDFHTTVNCLKIVMPDNINLKKQNWFMLCVYLCQNSMVELIVVAAVCGGIGINSCVHFDGSF